MLTLCGALYLSMWSSYLYFNAEVVHNGDKIKLRDAVGNFIKSPAVKVGYSIHIKKISHLNYLLSGVLEKLTRIVATHAA